MTDEFTDRAVQQAMGRELKDANRQLKTLTALVALLLALFVVFLILVATGTLEFSIAVDEF